jgi:predicted amidohydrolase
MSFPPLDVALCQYRFDAVDSIDELTERAETLFERAGTADVYVLPELFAVDAVRPTAGALPTLAESEFDALRAWCRRQAEHRNAVVVAGSAYVEIDGTIRNRSLIATPDGTVVAYDKLRPIPQERSDGVVPGKKQPPLIQYNGTEIGVLLCYDVEFPSVARSAVDRGAELLVVPSWTAHEGGYQRVRRCAAARAVENQVYVAQVCLVGSHPTESLEGGTGRSALFAPCDDVVGADGTRLSLSRDRHAAATTAVDLERLRTARQSASVRPYTDTEVFEP